MLHFSYYDWLIIIIKKKAKFVLPFSYYDSLIIIIKKKAKFVLPFSYYDGLIIIRKLGAPSRASGRDPGRAPGPRNVSF